MKIRSGLLSTVGLSAVAFGGLATAVGTVVSDGMLGRTYAKAFQAVSAPAVEAAAAHRKDGALLHLTASARAPLQGVLGHLAKGDTFMVTSPDGRLQALTVTEITPLPLSKASTATAGRLLLVTCRSDAFDSGPEFLHFVVEEKAPIGQLDPAPATRPL
ncbi:MAG: hypothetical protein RLZ98_1799 [Pseudomonadota bacterium]|jgi:hypothetical protein